jgi:uncharacterized membrane protein YdfJ with MMPL/SSD domain
MKKKRCIAVIALLIIMVTVPAVFAQDQDFDPKQMLADLKERLELSEEQIAQVRPIIKEQGQALRAIVEKYKGQGFLEKRSMKEDVQKLREDTQKHLESILTVPQMKEVNAFQDELSTQLREKIRDRIISNLATRLNLTEEQTEHIRPILEENITKRRELIEKYQGQGRQAFQAFREDNQQLQQETETQLEAILTGEQMREYKALQEEIRGKIREEIETRRQKE